MKVHAGRYISKKLAEAYARYLRDVGDLNATVEEIKAYDVMVEMKGETE